MSVNSNVVSITVTNSGGNNCNCPNSEVCANSNGTCPSGTFPDNYNIGCCIPCSQLIPYAITDVNVEPVNVYNYMNVYNNNAYPSCSTCYTSCKTDNSNNQAFFVNVTGKLVDSNGHGICNAQVSASISPDLVTTVVTYDILALAFPDTATVTWGFIISPNIGVTNSDGNFSIPLIITITEVQAATIPMTMDPGCYAAAGPNIVPFLVTIKVPNTTVTTQASGQLVFYSSISKPT